MKKFLISVALIALAGSALAQDSVTMVNPDALAWKDNPNIPKGGQVAVLVGDPTKAGSVVVQRVKLPANYKVPPHTHPYAETGKARALCLDRKRGGDHPSSVHRPGRHRLHQPG